tara:strand:+ start:480 stop:713 length:234 start_codon:yes stop_codon:yes gene_type:complete
MKKKKASKLEVAVGRFSAKVRSYILMEYRPTYNRIYRNIKITRDARKLCAEYYLGGNTIPFTAGQIVDYVRSKYKDE